VARRAAAKKPPVVDIFCEHDELRYGCEECDESEVFVQNLARAPRLPAGDAPERVEVDTFFVDPVNPLSAVLVAAGDEVPSGLLGRKRRKAS
jgi:hypothetical protein